VNPADLKGLTNLEWLLVLAVGGLGGTIAILFKNLMDAGKREVDAYKACLPIVAKFTELCERLSSSGGKP
jgi:hypothetical protein